MPGQRGSERRKLTEVIGIRVTPEEYLRLAREAEVAGLTIAALTRRRLLGLHIAARVDDELIRELRKQGGLVNKAIVRSGLREEGRIALRAIRRATPTRPAGSASRAWSAGSCRRARTSAGR